MVIGLVRLTEEFEGIAKTNTTHTNAPINQLSACLRVLLKQIQHTQGKRIPPSDMV